MGATWVGSFPGLKCYTANVCINVTFPCTLHVHCRDCNIFSSHGLLPSDLVAQSVERRRSNPKVVGSIPTLVRVFLCPCVGPFPSVRLTLTWLIWDRNLALHITLYSVNSVTHYLLLQRDDVVIFVCLGPITTR